MASEHLSVPWDLAWEDGKHGVIAADVDGEWKMVALVGNMTPDDGKNNIRRANAEFIVRACNSHDELLAACNEALEYIYSPYQSLAEREAAASKLRAALAKSRPADGE